MVGGDWGPFGGGGHEGGMVRSNRQDLGDGGGDGGGMVRGILNDLLHLRSQMGNLAAEHEYASPPLSLSLSVARALSLSFSFLFIVL